VRDGRRDAFGLAQQPREGAPILHVGRGDHSSDQNSGGVDQHLAFDAIDLFAPSNPREPATGDALTLEESTTAAVGRLRRPDRMRTSPRIAVRMRVQIPARHQRGKCLCAADQLTVKWCGRCRHAQPVRCTYRMASRYRATAPAGTADRRADDPGPKALAAGMARQRWLAKSLSRKQKGSCNRRDAAAKLGRHHHHVANVRRHFLHQVSNELVKTHDRFVIEDLNVLGMLANHRLARAISDSGWAEFARILGYKQAWRGGTIMIADRWHPSSKLCPACGAIRGDLTLADRVFNCGCGHSADRDTNAAVNLARWGQAHHETPPDPRTPKHEGRATNARRRDGTDQHPTRAGETSPVDAGTDVHTAPGA
jgi:IS605 OrfB family transposase